LKYLLDTNIISEPLKKSPSRLVMRKLTEEGHLCVLAAPVWHELSFGVARSPHPDRFRFLLELRSALRILPYDQRAADWHADERARLERAGKAPSVVDGMIAAIAVSNGLVLVSRNLKHFRSFRGLSLERW
jgi:tRNA(fMet)-specific endonuclease VapC